MDKVRKFFMKWGGFFCDGMTCEKNRQRDVIVIGLIIISLTGILFSGRFSVQNKAKKTVGVEERKELSLEEIANEELEKDIVEELKIAEENTDMSQWPEYKNAWFGFSLKYPEEWKMPLIQHPLVGSNWEQRIQFRKKVIAEDNSYIGYDVVVYDTNKVKEIMDTQDFPALKIGKMRNDSGCDTIEGHLFETGNYPAEEIYIPTGDDCYESSLFFTFTKDQYIYNLVPRKKEGLDILEDQRMELLAEMPEFFASVSTLGSIDIVRTKSIAGGAAKPGIRKRIPSAPLPLIYKRDSLGRRVCNKGSHDKPGKSKQNKGKHMDMECCLDPDEYPNPHCYYPPSKYGKYL